MLLLGLSNGVIVGVPELSVVGVAWVVWEVRVLIRYMACLSYLCPLILQGWVPPSVVERCWFLLWN